MPLTVSGGTVSDGVDPSNLQVALTAMANEFGASSGRRSARADQLSGDSQAMWSIAMTSPTVNAAMGYRTATESGSGRGRLEPNRPPETGAAAPV